MSNDKKRSSKASFKKDKNSEKKPLNKRASVKKNTTAAKKTSSSSDEIRLNKYIANSGVCSRREADMHISVGSVTVNGKVVSEMGYKVKRTDEVRFDGARINPEKKAYVLLNKPKGFATTTSESKGKTVMDLVANATKSSIKPIGRLGRGATGLLLFTNDEEVTQKLMKSKVGVRRLFHLELDKAVTREDLEKIRDGVMIFGEKITVKEISYIDGAPKKEVGVEILNTGHSALRSIFEHLNYEIVRTDCVMLHGLTKKDLPRGHWRHLTAQEVINLKHF
jgi:23S rRNA pseudouridine2605 synthase